MDENDWMWGIKVEETDRVVTSGICNWPSHMGSLNYGYANYSQGMQINKQLFASIADTDVRKGWWLDENGESKNLTTAEQKEWVSTYYKPYTQVKFGPYNNVVGQSTNANDIPLMRIEEMYLIKAEAEAMGGNPSAGKSTLNDFVKTYRDPEYTCSASSASDIQEEVYRQRRIELWGEGLSWYDIMRLNKPVDRRQIGTRVPRAEEGIRPIPDILRIRQAERCRIRAVAVGRKRRPDQGKSHVVALLDGVADQFPQGQHGAERHILYFTGPLPHPLFRIGEGLIQVGPALRCEIQYI